MNNYSMTYCPLDCSRNLLVSAKYVVNNLVLCGNCVSTRTHILIARILQKNILNVKALASRKKKKSLFRYSEARQCSDAVKELAKSFCPALLARSSGFFLRNTAPPLRVAAVEAWHHHIAALSVGIHRALSVTPYFYVAIWETGRSTRRRNYPDERKHPVRVPEN